MLIDCKEAIKFICITPRGEVKYIIKINLRRFKVKTIKSFLAIDEKYKSVVNNYGSVDGIYSVVSYVLVMVLYYVMGVVYAEHNLYLGYQINLLLAIVCMTFVFSRRQTMESIGFGKRNLIKSIILGTILSTIIVLINLVPGLMGGREFQSFSRLGSQFLYYFVIIALVEEIIFRGFIQTRIYGIIKKPVVAILLTSFMFMSMHIPFQMGAAHMDFFTYISNNFVTLIFIFGWHIIFNYLYAKYNSIAAPTIFHAFMDWSNYLFVR